MTVGRGGGQRETTPEDIFQLHLNFPNLFF